MHQRKLGEIVAGQELLSVDSGTLVVDAAKQMMSRNVAALLIIDDGELTGIFTERDMLRRVVAVGRDPSKTTLADVMTQGVISLSAERIGFEAVALMQEHGMRHVAVTGVPEKNYGIVSIRDFALSELSAFAKEIEFEEKVWTSI